MVLEKNELMSINGGAIFIGVNGVSYIVKKILGLVIKLIRK